MIRMYMAKDIYHEKLSMYHMELEPGDVYPKHISEYIHLIRCPIKYIYLAKLSLCIGHCMERLRQFIMCNADPTLVTLYWQPGVKRAVANYTTTRSCVNWDKLHSWAVDNMFDLSPKTVQNPEFGTHGNCPSIIRICVADINRLSVLD